VIYGTIPTRDAPSSLTMGFDSQSKVDRKPFMSPAPDSITRELVTDATLGPRVFTTTAPGQEGTLDAKYATDADPSIVATPAATGQTVQQLPPRTVSAGAETVRNSRRYDLPLIGNGWAYRLLRGGIRSTMLAPELQSELDADGAANVMPAMGMNRPTVLLPAQPWYESFSRTIG
jgi:hypothetical protein